VTRYRKLKWLNLVISGILFLAAAWIIVSWARPRDFWRIDPYTSQEFSNLGWSFRCGVYRIESQYYYMPLTRLKAPAHWLGPPIPSRCLMVIVEHLSEGNPQWVSPQESRHGSAGIYFKTVKVAIRLHGDYVACQRYELYLPPWLAIILLLICPAVFVRRQARYVLRRKRGHCIKCGYNLTGNASGICPECGMRT